MRHENSATSILKVKTLNSGASLTNELTLCCLTTAQQSAQYVAQQTLNWDTKVKNKCYTLVEKFFYFAETKYFLLKYIINIKHFLLRLLLH